MKVRILSLLLVCSALCAAQTTKKKKPQTSPEPSPLDKYISDAYKDGSSPQAVHPPGSTWSQNALFSNLGMECDVDSTTGHNATGRFQRL